MGFEGAALAFGGARWGISVEIYGIFRMSDWSFCYCGMTDGVVF